MRRYGSRGARASVNRDKLFASWAAQNVSNEPGDHSARDARVVAVRSAESGPPLSPISGTTSAWILSVCNMPTPARNAGTEVGAVKSTAWMKQITAMSGPRDRQRDWGDRLIGLGAVLHHVAR